MKYKIFLSYLTREAFISPQEPFLPQDVDEELLSVAEVHTAGVNFVEQHIREPGAQECCPANYQHHPHLIKNIRVILNSPIDFFVALTWPFGRL